MRSLKRDIKEAHSLLILMLTIQSFLTHQTQAFYDLHTPWHSFYFKNQGGTAMIFSLLLSGIVNLCY